MSKGVRLLGAVTCVAAVVLAAGATIAPAADQGGGARFHVVLGLNTGGGFDPTCAGFTILTHGTAVGTHVGAGTWSASECVDPFTHPGQLLAHGHAVLTAADGSQLVIDYNNVSGVPDANGDVFPVGTYTVTSGTGRFEGSTGSGSLNAVGHTATFTGSGTLEGTIVLGH